VRPEDPVTYIAVLAVLSLAAFVASSAPACRALGVDPILALHFESASRRTLENLTSLSSSSLAPLGRSPFIQVRRPETGTEEVAGLRAREVGPAFAEAGASSQLRSRSINNRYLEDMPLCFEA
jgi:hypothetical protein